MKHKVKNTMPRIISLQICSVVLACTVFPVQLSAQSLQRIFSTPAMRAELDRLRFQVATGGVIEESAEESLIDIPIFSDDEEQELVYALGGSIRKDDGSYTVWVNDVAYDQSNLPGNMELLSPFSQGQLRIRDTGSAANYNVKPGQVLNLTTGQLYESYQYQAVLEAAAAEAARLAIEEAANTTQGAGTGTGSAILDSGAVNNLLDAAQDL
ncbi:MAG: hypothetical protein ACI80L_001876 [Pseudohongiellaceae bacterium]|jgi:hypothetical protein